ncbi:hypothetical protein AB0N31_35490 [Streptomyces sp. NPDC051051]|uniref:hypothetical protein n=1 Tax=Streptomyces sp. NPDC051051 TaxID=3155666 RepID=UPI00343B76D9
MADVTSGGEYRRAAQEQEQPRVVPLGESRGHGQEPGPEQGRAQGQGLGRRLGAQSPAAEPADPSANPSADPSVDPVTGDRDPRAAASGGVPAGAVEDSGGFGTSRGTGDPHGTHDTPRGAGAAHGVHDADGAPLLPHDECDKLSERMRHAVAGFVDRPRDAVEEADHVLEELAARFTDAVNSRRRTLRGSWQLADGRKGAPAETADTEQLRLALRDYRELTDRLLHL